MIDLAYLWRVPRATCCVARRSAHATAPLNLTLHTLLPPYYLAFAFSLAYQIKRSNLIEAPKVQCTQATSIL